MILYTSIIAIIDGLIASTIIARYFNIKPKNLFIASVAIIYLIEVSVFSGIQSFSNEQVYITFLTWVLITAIIHRKNIIDIISLCMLVGLFMLLSNYVALLIISFASNVSFSAVHHVPSLYMTEMLLSNILYFIFGFGLYKGKEIYERATGYEQWGVLGMPAVLVVSILTVLLESIVTDTYRVSTAVTILVLNILILAIFIFILYRLSNASREREASALELQKIKYSKENYTIVDAMCTRIEKLEHRMIYILMQLKLYIKKNEKEKALQTIADNIEEIKKIGSVINTHNHYFDFMLNRTISDLALNKIYIKPMLLISKNAFYEQTTYVLIINSLVKHFSMHLGKDKQLSLSLTEESGFSIVRFFCGVDDSNAVLKGIPHEAVENLEKLNARLNVSTNENSLNYKFIVKIEKEE